MGTEPESRDTGEIELLRRLAARQGVHPSDDDLQAVLGFLETILPELTKLEEQLPPEEGT
jgi:hypothetical protein